LIFWLATSIIPAATARETPHALRILNSLPVWQIFIAFGMLSVYRILVHPKKPWQRWAYCLLIFVLYLSGITYYLHNYYVHYPRLFSGEWQYGYKQAILYVNGNDSRFNKIYISESIGRAYMYTLFYSKYDPLLFQKSKISYFDAAGFYHVDGFDKYVFTDTLPDNFENSALYVFPHGQVPQNVKTLQTIQLLNGNPVLTIFEK